MENMRSARELREKKRKSTALEPLKALGPSMLKFKAKRFRGILGCYICVDWYLQLPGPWLLFVLASGTSRY